MTPSDVRGPSARGHKHIVMLVANGVSGDSRVQKSAASAAAAGYRVTVVGVSSTGTRSVERLGDVTVVRVAATFPSYNAAKRKAVLAAREQASSTKRIAQTASRAKAIVKPSMKARRSRVTNVQTRVGHIKTTGAGWAHKSYLRSRILAAEVLIRLQRLGVRQADRALLWAERRAAEPRGLDLKTEEELFRAKLDDFAHAYLPELRSMSFDLVHAHDFTMIECGARAVASARGATGRPALVYDAHEWVRGLTHLPMGTQTVSRRVEAENISAADAVVTVSPVLAEHLQQENDLAGLPEVVLNAPVAAAYDSESSLSVRERAGVAAGVPLAVYGGAVKASRGVSTIIKALPLVPDLHLAIVASDSKTAGVREVLAVADEFEVAERVHIIPYVQQDEVSSYLRSADVGIHPLLRSGNAELALPNKLFEYMHAGLPMVVSDMPSMSKVVREYGWGEVFTAGDHEALAAALRQVLVDPEAYATGLRVADVRERFSWERQAEILVGIYDRLLFGDEADGAAEALGAGRAST